MKNTILLFLVLTLICCKQNKNEAEEEKPMSFYDFSKVLDEISASSKSNPKKNQILFMNYHLNMTEAKFDSVTKKNIKEGIMKIYKDTLYLNLEKGCNFKITRLVENNKLKIIYLQYVWEFNKNSSSYDPKTYYEIYYKILRGKYGRPICSYETIDNEKFNSLSVSKENGATWIKDGIIIGLEEYNTFDNSVSDHFDEFIQTDIIYQELADRQKRIKDNQLSEKRENAKRNIERSKLEKENLKKDSIFQSKF